MLRKWVALFCLGAGVFLLMQVFLPFLAYKFWELSSYDASQILTDPYPQRGDLGYTDNSVLVENIGNFPAFIVKSSFKNLPYKEFKLTVSKIKLEDVMVKVYSNDFEQILAHLPGSALPGERGNVFITGHSALPTAFTSNKTSKAYFGNLSQIKKGDEVVLESLGQRFTYGVVGMKIVDPKDLSVLNPPDREGRYVSLMTCVPPGFNTKRLVVLAKLKQ